MQAAAGLATHSLSGYAPARCAPPGAALLTGYSYSGRMRMTHPSGGIGVTFLSQFPSGAAYYRLRRYGNTRFHLSPLGTLITPLCSQNSESGSVSVAVNN